MIRMTQRQCWKKIGRNIEKCRVNEKKSKEVVCNEKKSKEVVCERKWEETRTKGNVTYFWISTVKLSGVINQLMVKELH